jgi:hypothetical protein
MANPRKASPALYELIGRQTRVTSGKQIGGRDHPDEAPASHGAPAPTLRPAPARPVDRSHHEAPPPSPLPRPLQIARPPSHADPRSADAAPHIDAPVPAPIGPGRSVRVPTGYFLFGAAAVLAAAIGGYMFGFVQKEREVTEAERQAAQLTGTRLTEPTDGALPPPSSTQPGKQTATRTQPGPAGGSATSNTAAPSTQIPGVTIVGKGVADPRTVGKNYAVVASLGQDRAIEVAEFLARSGVESAVLPRNTGGFYPVVSLTGFAKEEFRGKARQDHENRLRELGKQYAKQGGGRKDFSDLWWFLHKG